MMVPVTKDASKRRITPWSRYAAGEVAAILAQLGSPASDVNGRRLEREVHEALARLRTQSREQARRASRSPERP
jgi:hypothetical protein